MTRTVIIGNVPDSAHLDRIGEAIVNAGLPLYAASARADSNHVDVLDIQPDRMVEGCLDSGRHIAAMVYRGGGDALADIKVYSDAMTHERARHTFDYIGNVCIALRPLDDGTAVGEDETAAYLDHVASEIMSVFPDAARYDATNTNRFTPGFVRHKGE